jgi:hypothetical protein
MSSKKELIYPKLLECCDKTESLYWIQVFEDLAYGKLPYGCYTNNEFLCCNFKGKKFSYKIDYDKDSSVLFTEIYDLLHNKLGVISDEQRKTKLEEIENTESDWKNKKWNTIKKKNVKDILMDNFIISMKKTYNLNYHNTAKLKNTILLGLIFKTITSKDIEYENGKVTQIIGINFANNEIIIDDNIIDYKINEKENPQVNKKFLINLWKPFSEEEIED